MILKMITKWQSLKWLLIGMSLLSLKANSQELVDCNNENLVTSIFNDPIALNYNESIIMRYTNVLIDGILDITNNEFDKLYITARLESSNASISNLLPSINNSTTMTKTQNLIIYTTDQFQNYAREQTAQRISLKITMSCGEQGRTRTLVFFQPFLAANYFAPLFSQAIYEIDVRTPLAAGLDLTLFTPIYASDYDLINNRIHFNLTNVPSDFAVSVGTKNASELQFAPNDGKTVFARLLLERTYMRLPSLTTLQLMAMDNGIPPRNATVTVIIRSDTQLQPPLRPKFDRSVYYANITKDLTMEPLTILLLPNTYTRNVTFTMQGSDSQWFNLNIAVANVLELQLGSKSLPMEIVRSRRNLELEIIAENQLSMEAGSTAVFVELPSFKENFNFMQDLYEGVIDTGMRLQVPIISFDEFTYSSAIEFSLNGAAARYFRLRQVNNQLQLQLNASSLTPEALDVPYISLRVLAQQGSNSASTNIILQVPPKVTAVPAQLPAAAAFEKPLYIGNVSADLVLQIEPISFNNYDMSSLQLDFSLSGEKSNYFVLDIRNASLQLRLSNAVSRLPPLNTSRVLLTLRGRNVSSSSNVETTILLDVFQLAVPTAAVQSMPKFFALPFYKGRLEYVGLTQQQLLFEPIALEAGFDVRQLSFSLKGEEASHFGITGNASDNRVHFRLVKPIEDDVLASHVHLLYEFHVRHSQLAVNNTLVVVVELQQPVCSENNSSSLIPQQLDPLAGTGSIQFESSEYIFDMQPNQNGPLAKVTARGTAAGGAMAVTVSYSLDVPTEHLQRRLLIDSASGELRVLSSITPGVYYFHIVAVNARNSTQAARAFAKLIVDAVQRCNNQSSQVANSLIVKHIKEEVMHENIFSMSRDNCTFEVMSVLPADKEYVIHNAITSMLSTVAIDREDPIFANMSVPQIRIRLKLFCENSPSPASRSKRAARAIDEQSLLSIGDIAYASDETILLLIIDDINDNAPQFVQPASNAYFAYPAASISFELFPEYLTRVLATDMDVGLNARISYSMRANEHFEIDAVTGIVYPKIGALSNAESTELIISATDRAGAVDGLTTSIILSVRRLTSDFYTLLTYEGNTLQGMDDVIMELAGRTGYNVTVLRRATITRVPVASNETQRLGRVDAKDVLQQAWVYAFAQNEPISSDQLQGKIVELMPGEMPLASAAYNAIGLTSNLTLWLSNGGQNNITNTINDSTGYIIALVILSLLTTAMFGFIYWRHYPQYLCCNQLRPDPPVTTHTTDISCTIFNANAANAARGGTNSYIGNTTTTFKPPSSQSDHVKNEMTEADLNDIWCSQK